VGPRWRDSGLVFTWPDGRPLHPERFSKWFEQLARAAGLPRIRLHDVRHSYATAALAAGIPAKVVSERLGHATIAITMDTYRHVLPGLDAEAAGTVARFILGDRDQEPARPVDKALTTDRPTPSRREEVKREAPGQGVCERGDSNPHGLPHRDLNPARLPFRHARELRWSLQQRVRGPCSAQVVAGRSWTAQALPSGSLKKMKEFQRPPGPSTRVAPS
jgi:hypothetical protein